jgi:hypothetical protein
VDDLSLCSLRLDSADRFRSRTTLNQNQVDFFDGCFGTVLICFSRNPDISRHLRPG